MEIAYTERLKTQDSKKKTVKDANDKNNVKLFLITKLK